MHLSKNREHHEQTKQNCRVIDATDFSQSDLTTADPEINSYLYHRKENVNTRERTFFRSHAVLKNLKDTENRAI
jgi:hypothetical protein